VKFSQEVPESVRGVRKFIGNSSAPANVFEHELVKGGEKAMTSPTEGQEPAATQPMGFALNLQGMPADQLVERAAGGLSSLLSINCCTGEVLREAEVPPVVEQPG
jgi:hypothetical protein